MKKIYLVIFLAFFPAFSSSLKAQTPDKVMGVNLSYCTYWSSQQLFVDAMKQSGYLRIRDVAETVFEIPNSALQYPQRADGYPTQVPFMYQGQSCKAHTLMLAGMPYLYPAGTYNIIFDGTGSVSVDFDAEKKTFTQGGILNPFKVTPTINMYGTVGIHMTIETSSAADPVRNVRVIMPGFENTYQTQPFHPRVIELLKKFKIIRGIHALMINDENPTPRGPQDITPTNYTTQSANWKTGLSYDYLIDLCNTTNCDVWLNFPHLANDALIEAAATLFKNRLKPGLKVYVEWSNETWNHAYPFNLAANYVEAQGKQLGFSTNDYQAGRFYTAHRSFQVFDIFKRVYNSDTTRYVRVLAAHGQNFWTGGQELLAMADPAMNPTRSRADAISIAPYFGGGVGDYLAGNNLVNSTTPDIIIDYLYSEIDTVIKKNIQDYRQLKNDFKVKLIAYEGGQHLVGNQYQSDTALTRLLTNTNRHPRMKDLYCHYYDTWYQNGGEEFVTFNFINDYSKFGSWGQLEHLMQDTATAPKWQALNTCIFKNGTVGISSAKNTEEISMWPNPVTQGILNISGVFVKQITLYNLMGEKVLDAYDSNNIDVSSLKKGVYIYQLQSTKATFSKGKVVLN